MPHVIVNLLSGRTEQQQAGIAEEVTKAIMATTGNGADAVSVAIEDVERKDWVEKVYKLDIAGHWDQLFKKPGNRAAHSPEPDARQWRRPAAVTAGHRWMERIPMGSIAEKPTAPAETHAEKKGVP